MLEKITSSPGIIIGIVPAVIVLLFLILGCLKAPPDTAYIISGLGKKLILTGRNGLRAPFF